MVKKRVQLILTFAFSRMFMSILTTILKGTELLLALCSEMGDDVNIG